MLEGTAGTPDMYVSSTVCPFVFPKQIVVIIVWYCIQIPYFILAVIYYLVVFLFASKPKCFYFV